MVGYPLVASISRPISVEIPFSFYYLRAQSMRLNFRNFR